MDELLTPDEAAKELKVHINSIYAWLESGKLAGIRIGYKKWRIRREDLLKMKEPKNV